MSFLEVFLWKFKERFQVEISGIRSAERSLVCVKICCLLKVLTWLVWRGSSCDWSQCCSGSAWLHDIFVVNVELNGKKIGRENVRFFRDEHANLALSVLWSVHVISTLFCLCESNRSLQFFHRDRRERSRSHLASVILETTQSARFFSFDNGRRWVEAWCVLQIGARRCWGCEWLWNLGEGGMGPDKESTYRVQQEDEAEVLKVCTTLSYGYSFYRHTRKITFDSDSLRLPIFVAFGTSVLFSTW